MNAAFGVGDEGAFEVDSDGSSGAVVCGGFDGVGDAFERSKRLLDRRGDGCREVVSDAVTCHEAAHCSESVGCAFHHVVVDCAVCVDIEEGGRQGRGFVLVARV
jgi:hypothetical protein